MWARTWAFQTGPPGREAAEPGEEKRAGGVTEHNEEQGPGSCLILAGAEEGAVKLEAVADSEESRKLCVSTPYFPAGLIVILHIHF